MHRSHVSQRGVVFYLSCDLCDADYFGYTARRLHQRIAEHKSSAIGKHFLEAHADANLLNESQALKLTFFVPSGPHLGCREELYAFCVRWTMAENISFQFFFCSVLFFKQHS